MGSRSVLGRLPPEVRAQVEQRQEENGYSDIDGLRAELAERGYDGPGFSRSNLGYVNEYLKAQADDLKRKKSDIQIILDSGIQDIGLVNAVLFHNAIQDILSQLNIADIDLSELHPMDRMALFLKLSRAQLDVAKSIPSLKQERRLDQTAATVEATLAQVQAINPGVSDEMAEAIKVKLLGKADDR